MSPGDFRDALICRGARLQPSRVERTLSFSSKLLHGHLADGRPFVVRDPDDEDEKNHIGALADALLWRWRDGDRQPVVLMITHATPGVLQPLATLRSTLRDPSVLELQVGFRTFDPALPRFHHNGWDEKLMARSEWCAPPMALRLAELVADPSFRFYRNVTEDCWSGRVEGLQVCTVSGDGAQGWLGVGHDGKRGVLSHARGSFLGLVRPHAAGLRPALGGWVFSVEQTAMIAEIIRTLVRERRGGRLREVEREHRLEARVRRGAVVVATHQGAALRAVAPDPPFQFPTQWHEEDRARYVDALMAEGRVPWVIELKGTNRNGTVDAGEYLRLGVGQALLYREYIRQATWLHPWFDSHGLDATACRAALAVPALKPAQEKRRKLLLQVASHFDGFELIQLDDE